MMIEEVKEELEIHLLEMVQMTVESGSSAWALMSISPEKYQDYKVKVETGDDLDINEYGRVLAYGVGEVEPTPEENARLLEEFGYHSDLNMEEKLKKILGKDSG